MVDARRRGERKIGEQTQHARHRSDGHRRRCAVDGRHRADVSEDRAEIGFRELIVSGRHEYDGPAIPLHSVGDRTNHVLVGIGRTDATLASGEVRGHQGAHREAVLDHFSARVFAVTFGAGGDPLEEVLAACERRRVRSHGDARYLIDLIRPSHQASARDVDIRDEGDPENQDEQHQPHEPAQESFHSLELFTNENR